MNKISKISSLSAILLFFPVSAHAYLDPGTGSVLIQGILGAVAALSIVIKVYWHRILQFLGMRKSKEEGVPTDKQEDGKSS